MYGEKNTEFEYAKKKTRNTLIVTQKFNFISFHNTFKTLVVITLGN